MTHASLGVLGDGPRRIVSRDRLVPPAGLLRAQASSRATVLDANGAWSEKLADIARFEGPGQRLLIEGQRTNSNRNPRGEGATPGVVGSGGVLPTFWTLVSGSGLGCEVVTTGTQGGVDYVRLRFSGTAASTTMFLDFDTTTAIVAAPSQNWTGSLFIRLVAAPQLPNNLATRIVGRNSAGTPIAGNAFSMVVTPGATLDRVVQSVTLLSDASLARISQGVRATMTVGLAYDFTLDLGWPQFEQSAFASTPILPVAGTLAATTRGADLATVSLAAVGIGASGAGTLLCSGVIERAAPAGQEQIIMQVDNGTASNAFVLLNLAGGTQIALRRVLAGAAADVVLGSVPAGTDFRVGMAMNGAGQVAASLNAGAVQVLTGGPGAGLTTCRIGHGAAGDRVLFGKVASVAARGFPIADGWLPAAVGALPA